MMRHAPLGEAAHPPTATPGTASEHGESAGDRAYRILKRRILTGDLGAGDMLGEAATAAALGVSRTPVRAALGRLQDESWVKIYPKRGALILGLDEATIIDLAEARLMLEREGVLRSSEGVRSTAARSLEPLIDEQADALSRTDVDRFIESTIAFHRVFVSAGRNGILTELGDRLADRQRFLLHAQRDRLIERREQIINEHRVLADALSRGDADAFARAHRSHLGDTHGVPLHGV